MDPEHGPAGWTRGVDWSETWDAVCKAGGANTAGVQLPRADAGILDWPPRRCPGLMVLWRVPNRRRPIWWTCKPDRLFEVVHVPATCLAGNSCGWEATEGFRIPPITVMMGGWEGWVS